MFELQAILLLNSPLTILGINVKDVLENSARIKKNVTTRERESQVTKAADHLQEALELQRESNWQAIKVY